MKKYQTNFNGWSHLLPILPNTVMGGKPGQKSLYLELRKLIEMRHIIPGEKLPPSRDLSKALDVSRGMVVCAYDQLIAEGYAITRTGSGTFVANEVPIAAKPSPQKPKINFQLSPEKPKPGIIGSGMADEQSLTALRQCYRAVLANPPQDFLHYGDLRGSHELRLEIANYLRVARAMQVDPELIVITSGSLSALDLVVRSTLPPQSAVWLENPCYQRAHSCLTGAGVNVIPIDVEDDGLDVDQAIQSHPHAKAVYLTPSHQFPSGVALSMPKRLKLIEWANDTGSWIFEDDYDSEFRYSGSPLAALHGLDSNMNNANRVIYLGTFSKAIAPGMRLGFAVLPEALVNGVVQLRSHTDRGPCAITQQVMARFLTEGYYSTHLKRARKRASNARDALVNALNQGPFDISPPNQGLHLIARSTCGYSENQLLTACQNAGLTAKGLSSLYLDSGQKNRNAQHNINDGKKQGLVIGFSGFAPQHLRKAAEKLVAELKN